MNNYLSTLIVLSLVACNPPPSDADLAGTKGSRVEVFFNDPGSRLETVWHADAQKLMVSLVNQAQSSIRFAVMGFTNDDLVDALAGAYDRGIDVKMVGDAGHIYNSGYLRFSDRHIPMSIGNMAHIMHDKFMVVDDRFVFASTANWSDSDLFQNSNNFAMLDSPPIAADFTAEHEQMFQGVFSNNKEELDNGRVYELGDTTVEVWFSPNEDAMGRVLELVDAAQESVRFTIFAMTKDQLGSSLIRKHQELVEKGLVVDGDIETGVAGVIDQSQLHSNGQYHEAFRLLGAKIPLRLDGNNAESLPGDYQAGGGRLHSKTMIIDPDGEDPIVISGSFNWSASATQSNDEYLLVFHGQRIAQLYKEYFAYLYNNGRDMGLDFVGKEGPDGQPPLEPGDVVIDEVHWYGVHANDSSGFDEFLELRNMTDRDLRLDMWQIAGVDDFVVGIPPGMVLPAGGRFSILDHVIETYVDGAPQDQNTAFLQGNMVVNAFNDDRQARLYLKDEALQLFLLDADANLVDTVGDGGPAFAGGPNGNVVRSMQRAEEPGDGSLPENWSASAVTEGNENVNPAAIVPGIPDVTYRNTILATPGEPPE